MTSAVLARMCAHTARLVYDAHVRSQALSRFPVLPRPAALAALACVVAAPAPGCAERPAATLVSCQAAPPTLSPLVVDWSTDDLAQAEALAKQGLVVVHADGCSLRPLLACHAVGTYAYAGFPPSVDTVVLGDDWRAFTPGAATRVSALGRRGPMRLERTLVGQWVATRAFTSPAQLMGDCDRATHVIRRVWVGAYDFASGQRSLAARGNVAACTANASVKGPPEGCSAWVKVELAPLVATPSAGQACEPALQGCVDSTHALFCASGRVRPVPCRGKSGCSLGADGAHCDDSSARPGDPCPPNAAPTYACSPDGAEALTCSGATFELWRHCRGPKHCSLGGGEVQCDTTSGEVGDPCGGGDGGVACSVDGARILGCVGGHLVPAGECQGAHGCTVDPTTFRALCDKGTSGTTLPSPARTLSPSPGPPRAL